MFENSIAGTSLVVQWLRLHAPNAEGMGMILDQETKIPFAIGCDLNFFFIKKK